MIEVKGRKTEVVTVELDECELDKIVKKGRASREAMLSGLEKQYKSEIGIKSSAIIKKGMWWHEWEARGGSHGWWDEEDIRPATKSEKAFMKSLENIEQSFTMAALENKEGELAGS